MLDGRPGRVVLGWDVDRGPRGTGSRYQRRLVKRSLSNLLWRRRRQLLWLSTAADLYPRHGGQRRRVFTSRGATIHFWPEKEEKGLSYLEEWVHLTYGR